MVESVSNTTRAKVQAMTADASNLGVRLPTKPTRTAPAGAVDAVSLSEAATALPSGLDVGPPFDLEAVSKIKTAIAEGRYPIDVEKISSSLFESYRELVE